MHRLTAALLVALAFTTVADAAPGQTWVEGRDYVSLMTPQYTTVPAGKVEVMEVFSYGCPACNSFEPVMSKLRHSLPPNAQLVLLPASFSPQEDWPMFQRAYFTAQLLGIAERTHQGIFDAVWKTGELAVFDASHRLKDPQPSLSDAAHCYGRLAGIKPEEFMAAANSFAVDARMRAADDQILAMQVPGTPCIVVNGHYRVDVDVRRSGDDWIDLVRFLVAKETRH
jgi:protein dithiol oxidoreductase (disulfide-forming)